MTFHTNDLVKVTSQPHSLRHIVDLVGQVGYIEEMNNEKVLFQGLTPDGRLGEAGWILIQCLTLESSPHWKKAYSVFKNWMSQLTQGTVQRQERLLKVAKENGITVEKVLEISQAAINII